MILEAFQFLSKKKWQPILYPLCRSSYTNITLYHLYAFESSVLNVQDITRPAVIEEALLDRVGEKSDLLSLTARDGITQYSCSQRDKSQETLSSV